MATYKFPQFQAEITDPTIEVSSVTDKVKDKTCDVHITLSTLTAKFGVTLNGFTYSDTWEDEDVYAWLETQLETFKQ